MPETAAPIAEAKPNPTPESAPEEKPAVAPPPPGASGAGSGEGKAAEPAKAKDHAALAKEAFALREQRRAAKESVAKAEADAKAAIARAEAAELKAKEAAAELEEARKNGLQYSIRHGADPEKMIRGFVGDTAPEKLAAEANRRAEEALKEAAALKQALAERDKRVEAEAAESKKRAEEQYASAQITNVTKALIDAGKTYKYANAEWDKAEIEAKVREVRTYAVSKGVNYTFEEVASFLDKAAKVIHDERAVRRQTLLSEEEAPPSGAVNKGRVPGNGLRETNPGPGSRTAPKSVDAKRRLTREEEEAADLAALRAAFNADAKSRNGTSSKSK